MVTMTDSSGTLVLVKKRKPPNEKTNRQWVSPKVYLYSKSLKRLQISDDHISLGDLE